MSSIQESKDRLVAILANTNNTIFANWIISKSGMTHYVDCFGVDDKQIRRISHLIHDITNIRMDDQCRLVLKGAGYNPIADIADDLTKALGLKVGYGRL